MDSNTAVLAVFVAYLAALVGLAVLTRRGSGSMSGFFLGDRRLPGWALAFSTNATGESGWLLLGLTGMGYLVGVHAFWIVVGEVIGIGLSWALIARRLRRGAGEHDALTVPDFLAARFGDRAHVLRWTAVLIILAMVVTYTSAQVVATGKAFQTFLDWDYRVGAVLGAVVALAYTTVGGFRAVVWTDVLQGLLMLGGLIALPIAGFAAAGGWDAAMDSLRAQDPLLLDPLKGLGWSTAGIVAVATGLAVGLPFLGVPQLLVRYMAIRDERDVPQAATISILCLLVFTGGAVLTGLAGRALFPDLADHEAIMPLMSRELFPPLVTGLLLTVVLAAIMSTVDSLVLLASSAVVRDVAQQALGVEADEARFSRWSKLVTVLIGVIATAVALVEVRGIYWFVLFAWSGLGAAFGPVILCALFWKGMTRAGALAGMLAGFFTVIAWVLWVKEEAYGLYEAVPGFAAGFVALVLVSWLTAARASAASP